MKVTTHDMSTDYVPNKPISFSKVKKFNHNGITVDSIDEDGDVILTDGANYLHACLGAEIGTFRLNDDEIKVVQTNRYEGVMFTSYSANDPSKIIKAIEDYFGVTLVSEHDEEYNDIV